MKFNSVIASLVIPGVVFLFVISVVNDLYKTDNLVVDNLEINKSHVSHFSDETEMMTLLSHADVPGAKSFSCSSSHLSVMPNKMSKMFWNYFGINKVSLAVLGYFREMLSMTWGWMGQDFKNDLHPSRNFFFSNVDFSDIFKNPDFAKWISGAT